MSLAIKVETANVEHGTLALARAMAQRRGLPLRQYLDKLILEDVAREELRSKDRVEPVWALPLGRPRKVSVSAGKQEAESRR